MNMKNAISTGLGAVALAATLAFAPLPAYAQFQPVSIVEDLVKNLVSSDALNTLEVSVEGGFVDDKGIILPAYSSFGDKLSPPLQWTPGPEGTQSYAIIMQDAGELTFLHWALFNIPADVTSVPAGLAADPAGAGLGELVQLNNSMDKPGYLSPGLPKMELNEGYTPQVFALDTVLSLPATAKLQDLVDAMSGHVLAHGFVEGAIIDPSL